MNLFRFYLSLFYSNVSGSLDCYFPNLILNKRHGSQMLIKTASRPNHTSYRKFDTNEFVQNSLCCNMGIIIFDLRGCGGCYRSKTSHLDTHFGTLIQHSVHPTAPVLLTKTCLFGKQNWRFGMNRTLS